MTAKLIQVIEVEESRGDGIGINPCRIAKVYYATDGTKLAERDEWEESQRGLTMKAVRSVPSIASQMADARPR
jgi:hypothetical protein